MGDEVGVPEVGAVGDCSALFFYFYLGCCFGRQKKGSIDGIGEPSKLAC